MVETDPLCWLMRIVIEMIDPGSVERRGSPDQAVNLVSLVDEQLCEIGPVLAGDARYQGYFGDGSLPLFTSRP